MMQKRTRVKICGITQVDDAIYAAKSGADAIGLVFYSKSPRFVSVEQAKLIVEGVYPFTTIVGLFVNAEPGFINEVIDQVNLDLVQFHGDESKADCEAIKRPYMKALRIRDELTPEDITSLANEYDSAKAILLDSYQAGVPGGTGKIFDWQKIPDNLRVPLVLAGGLTVSNVRSAVESVRPYAVDVSGGVEKAKGIKDHVKIDSFMSEVINAD